MPGHAGVQRAPVRHRNAHLPFRDTPIPDQDVIFWALYNVLLGRPAACAMRVAPKAPGARALPPGPGRASGGPQWHVHGTGRSAPRIPVCTWPIYVHLHMEVRLRLLLKCDSEPSRGVGRGWVPLQPSQCR